MDGLRAAMIGVWAVCFASTFLGFRASANEPSAATEQPLLVIDAGGHTGWINRVLYWPYKNELITVSHDKSIRFWDLETGHPVRTLRPPIDRGNAGRVHAASLSPDNKYLAVGGESALRKAGDHAVYLIDPIEGRVVKTFAGHPSPIRCVAFSPDGQWLATSCYDPQIRLFRVEDGALRTLAGHTDSIVELNWSPDGRSLVSGSWDKSSRIWDVASAQTRHVLPHRRSVLAVAWSNDAHMIATGSSDNIVRLWSADGQLAQTWSAAPEHIDYVAFSPDSKKLLYGWGGRHSSAHGSAVKDLTTGREISRFLTQHRNALDGTFLPNGKTVVTAGFGGDVVVWDSTTGHVEKRLVASGGDVVGVGWSRDDRAVGWAHACLGNTSIKGTCPLTHSFCLHSLSFGPTPDAAFQQSVSQSGGYEIQRTKERVATVWFQGNYQSQFTLPQQDAKVRCRTLLTGGRAVVGCDYGMYVFNTQSGQGIYSLPGHFDAVLALAPSVSQRYLLSGSLDHTLEIWNTETYEHLCSLYFAGNEWIAWTPTGYYAASVGGEALMGWHVNQGPDQLGQYFPASRFHATHYRPDVIRALLDQRSVRQAVASANSQREAVSRPAVVTLTPPPDVQIVRPAPADAEAAVASPITLEATAKSRNDDPLTSLRVLVNGRPWESRPLESSAGTKTLETQQTFTLDLPAGKHQIVVRGDTATTYDLSLPVDVTVSGDRPADHPALNILAIGSDPAVGLTGTATHFGPDALRVAEALQSHADKQYAKVSVRTLTGEGASLAGILEGLDWLAQHTLPGDTAVLYWGSMATQTERGTAALLSADARGAEGALTGNVLQTRLARIRGTLLLWSDWRAGTPAPARTQRDFCLGESESPGSSSAGAAIDDLLRDLVATDQGVAVISANSGTAATAIAPPPTADGWLAQALIEGLSGKAATDGTAGVSLPELEDYVNRRVGELSANRWRPNVGRSPLIPAVRLAK
ncbi:MAG: WD40 repeat domain-containing protein [Planctomycetes bacterium]|nr:WD40 repeat domain-containing protein [Planctomycetota bacterium]